MFSDHVQWFGVKFSAGGFIAALTHGALPEESLSGRRTQEDEHVWTSDQRQRVDIDGLKRLTRLSAN
jgi:hypothetical protein